MKELTLPLAQEDISNLKAGDSVSLSGEIYTARDAAHKRLYEAISNGNPIPIDLKGAVIYYTGPCPAPPGRPINSCGPTTSKRMNAYAPLLYDKGVKCVIGKGQVSSEVKDAIIRNKCIYFCATGGLGALIALSVISAELIAYEDLLSEAIYKLTVKNMPLTVAIDSTGKDIFEIGPEQYKK